MPQFAQAQRFRWAARVADVVSERVNGEEQFSAAGKSDAPFHPGMTGPAKYVMKVGTGKN